MAFITRWLYVSVTAALSIVSVAKLNIVFHWYCCIIKVLNYTVMVNITVLALKD